MTSATRLKNLRKRVRASNEEKCLAGSKPTWDTHPRTVAGIQLFREHVGDPAEVLGDDWDLFFLPWHVLIECAPADMRDEFAEHQKKDGGKSWSFGEMVAREERDGVE